MSGKYGAGCGRMPVENAEKKGAVSGTSTRQGRALRKRGGWAVGGYVWGALLSGHGKGAGVRI